MPEPLATQNAIIGGHRIAHGVFGHGEAVVLIHGTPSSSLIWRNVVPHLVSAGFAVHVYDLLGYARSERPADPAVDTSIAAQVSVLEELLIHWGLRSAHIVAHDIGGGIAQLLAVLNPARVLSLALVDSVSFDSFPSPRTRRLLAPGLGALARAPDAEHRARVREWLLSAVQRPRALEASSLDTYVGYVAGPVGQASMYQHQVAHYDPAATLAVADRLHELRRLPVKLVWGADDAWQAPQWAQRLHAAIPGSELEVIGECGHFAPEDQPERLSQVLVEFLRRASEACVGRGGKTASVIPLGAAGIAGLSETW